MSIKLERFSQFLLKTSLVLVLLQTPFVVFLWSRFPEFKLVFKSVADFIIIVNFLISLVLAYRSHLKFKNTHKFLILALLYILMNVLAALGSLNWLSSVLAGLVINLRYVLVFVTVLILGNLDQNLRVKLIKLAKKLGLWVLGFALIQVILLPADFLINFGYSNSTIAPYHTIDQNPDYIRINSTLRGPNPLGAFAMIVSSLALVDFYHHKTTKLFRNSSLLVILSSLILFFSHSRSAWLAAFLSAVVIIVFCFKNHRRKVLVSLLAVLALGLALLAMVAIKHDQTVLREKFEHFILHDSSKTVQISSNQEHLNSLQNTWQRVEERWLWGHGTGSGGSASLLRSENNIIENQFLLVWYELGIVGFLTYSVFWFWVLVELFKRRHQALVLAAFSSGLGLILIGFLLPIFVDSAVALTWWILAGLALTKEIKGEKNGTTLNQKTTLNA